MRRVVAILLVLAGAGFASAAQDPALPHRTGSLKFAAMGDNGTGEAAEYEVARQMASRHGTFSLRTAGSSRPISPPSSSSHSAGTFTFGLFFATAIFEAGPVLTESKVGALSTIAGAPVTAVAASLLAIRRRR